LIEHIFTIELRLSVADVGDQRILPSNDRELSAASTRQSRYQPVSRSHLNSCEQLLTTILTHSFKSHIQWQRSVNKDI